MAQGLNKQGKDKKSPNLKVIRIDDEVDRQTLSQLTVRTVELLFVSDDDYYPIDGVDRWHISQVMDRTSRPSFTTED